MLSEQTFNLDEPEFVDDANMVDDPSVNEEGHPYFVSNPIRHALSNESLCPGSCDYHSQPHRHPATRSGWGRLASHLPPAWH